MSRELSIIANYQMAVMLTSRWSKTVNGQLPNQTAARWMWSWSLSQENVKLVVTFQIRQSCQIGVMLTSRWSKNVKSMVTCQIRQPPDGCDVDLLVVKKMSNQRSVAVSGRTTWWMWCWPPNGQEMSYQWSVAVSDREPPDGRDVDLLVEWAVGWWSWYLFKL